MKCKYAVTFEFETRAPETHRGTVEAGQPHVCVSRAVKEAKKVLRPINWTSLVCVLLERAGEEDSGKEGEDATAE